MKIARYLLAALVMVICANAPVQAQVAHNNGRVEFAIIGQGFLIPGIDAANPLNNVPNFTYPLDDANPGSYLQGFSGIWVGTENPPVASPLDIIDGGLFNGEWQQAPNGAPEEIATLPGRQTIRAIYQAGPTADSPLPFEALVEQTSYSWEDTSTPESNAIVLALTLTNQSSLPAENLRVTFYSNWDVDVFNPPTDDSLDMFEYDDDRQASIVFQGDPSEGENPVHVATVLMHGDVFLHRGFSVSQTPFLFSDADKAAITAAPGIFAESIIPGNYHMIFTAGPITLEGLVSRTVIFALVGGESRADLEENIDGTQLAITRAEMVETEVNDDGVLVTWAPAIRPNVTGYGVFRSLDENGPFEPLRPRFIDTLEFLDTEVSPGTTYHYRVMPFDENTRIIDAPSAVASATTSPKPPAVQQMRSTISGPAEFPVVTLDLEPPSGLDQSAVTLLLYRNETGEEPFTLIRQGDFETTLEDREVGPGKRYFYAVRLLNEFDRLSDLSTVVEAVTAPEQTTPSADLSRVVMFPNPVRRSLGQIVRFRNLPAPARIAIYNAVGDRVFRDANDAGQTFEWDPGADIASGVYIYQIEWAPEGESFNAKSAPKNTGVQRATGKFVLMD